ncbi:helix-turn-helix domain-containing protein [Streptomyces javensis]|uniref:helix-turn-helix domain-containing protein n=1 Tax=Streptomyces javensis TaxID=114698 RepID=UPI003CD062B6
MAQSNTPTMRSRRLGNELRRLRIEAALKVQDAADALECGHPKISQIENGKRGIRPLGLTVLFKLYGVEDERQCASLRRLAKEIHKVDWWSNQGPVLRDTEQLQRQREQLRRTRHPPHRPSGRPRHQGPRARRAALRAVRLAGVRGCRPRRRVRRLTASAGAARVGRVRRRLAPSAQLSNGAGGRGRGAIAVHRPLVARRVGGFRTRRRGSAGLRAVGGDPGKAALDPVPPGTPSEKRLI